MTSGRVKLGFIGVTVLVIFTCCMVVPVEKPPQPVPFDNIDSTTENWRGMSRDEVDQLMKLHDPFAQLDRFGNNEIWVYSSSRDTWKWVFCLMTGFIDGYCVPEIGRGQEALHIDRKFYVVVYFDQQGNVKTVKKISEMSRCSPSGICNNNGAISILSSKERNTVARNMVAPELCIIYVINEMKIPKLGLLSVSIDEQLAGKFVINNGYTYSRIEPGQHTIRGDYWGKWDKSYEPYLTFEKSFNCRVGQRLLAVYYLSDVDRIEQRLRATITEYSSARVSKRELFIQPFNEQQ